MLAQLALARGLKVLELMLPHNAGEEVIGPGKDILKTEDVVVPLPWNVPKTKIPVP